MAPAGGGHVTGDSGRPYKRRIIAPSAASGGAAAGQNIGAKSGSRKRKAAVMSNGSINLVGNGEYLVVPCKVSRRVTEEVKDLRYQLDEDVKELGCFEEIEKLKVELALKAKEMQCLSKQNEEMQAKNYTIMKQYEELNVKNDGLLKLNEELKTNNDGMRKGNMELQANNGILMKWNEELQGKNNDLWKRNEKLQAKNDSLIMQIEELETKNDRLRKRTKEVAAKNSALLKQNEELLAKNNGLKKQNKEIQAKSIGLSKRDKELQEKNEGMTKWNEKLQAKNDGLHKHGLKVELTGHTNFGTKISWDMIPESVQHLKQEEPTHHQAASSFKEMGRLKAQVTKLDTVSVINQLKANNRTLAKNNAALKEVAAYAAELERNLRKNKELESEKGSAQQLMAMVQEIFPHIFVRVYLDIPDPLSLEQMVAKLKELPEAIEIMTHKVINMSVTHTLEILKCHFPNLDLSVILREFPGTERRAEELADSCSAT